MPPLLKQTNWTVRAVGSLVEITLGNVPITMDYEICLDLAQSMRLCGRQAKANAGDKSAIPRFRAKGMLTDANADELRHQSLRDPTAALIPH